MSVPAASDLAEANPRRIPVDSGSRRVVECRHIRPNRTRPLGQIHPIRDVMPAGLIPCSTNMNKPWLIANLEDARQELERAIGEIKELDARDEHVAQQLIAETYIKLNYAWNSRASAHDSSDQARYDEWIKYPKVMDIYSGAEEKPSV
ncbi:MAG: hypothetical protein U1G05_16365 [Kiritimatiellia bacterium]